MFLAYIRTHGTGTVATVPAATGTAVDARSCTPYSVIYGYVVVSHSYVQYVYTVPGYPGTVPGYGNGTGVLYSAQFSSRYYTIYHTGNTNTKIKI